MATAPPDYDLRYLAGIQLFNEQEYFEAHEAWESIWLEGAGDDRRFYQGLIQAAVSLCHYANGNWRGARKLFQTSRAYLEAYPPHHHGLDLTDFRAQMDRCYAGLLGTPEGATPPSLNDQPLPRLDLQPPPLRWPVPGEVSFEDDEDE